MTYRFQQRRLRQALHAQLADSDAISSAIFWMIFLLMEPSCSLIVAEPNFMTKTGFCIFNL
jgi:hypothetical protein